MRSFLTRTTEVRSARSGTKRVAWTLKPAEAATRSFFLQVIRCACCPLEHFAELLHHLTPSVAVQTKTSQNRRLLTYPPDLPSFGEHPIRRALRSSLRSKWRVVGIVPKSCVASCPAGLSALDRCARCWRWSINRVATGVVNQSLRSLRSRPSASKRTLSPLVRPLWSRPSGIFDTTTIHLSLL